MKIWVRL